MPSLWLNEYACLSAAALAKPKMCYSPSRSHALLLSMSTLQRVPAANEGAARLQQGGNVLVAMPHGFVQRVHAVAVAHVKAGAPLLHQHPHLCSGGGA